MTTSSAAHSTFVIERSFAAPVARVFSAWSTAAKKRRWFACHDDWKMVDFQLDFQVGGNESNQVMTPAGSLHAYQARFLNIVPDERIVFVYDMHVAGAHISSSLVTIMFARRSEQTAMTFTEQVVFFDGLGNAQERREGTELGLDNLAAYLSAQQTSS